MHTFQLHLHIKLGQYSSHRIVMGFMWDEPAKAPCNYYAINVSWYLKLISVQFSRPVMSNSLRSHESQQARPPCPSPTPRVYSNSCPSGRWCHPAISSSVMPFSSCPQTLPVSGSFPMSQLVASGGQSIGASASASVLPKNTQDWSPLVWTGWVSLQSKGLSRVFSNTSTLSCLNISCRYYRITWECFKRFNFTTEHVVNFWFRWRQLMSPFLWGNATVLSR